jgi:DNA-binding transcriptional MerR regulator
MSAKEAITATKPEAVRIGEAAARAGVSTRTLRYYEELGLLPPSFHSPGGARRYSAEDVARLLRIRELQDLMGFDLDQIRTVLTSEDRLQRLRTEWLGGDLEPVRQREIVLEAIDINDELRREVRLKLARTKAFIDELEEKARKYRGFLRSVSEPSFARR